MCGGNKINATTYVSLKKSEIKISHYISIPAIPGREEKAMMRAGLRIQGRKSFVLFAVLIFFLVFQINPTTSHASWFDWLLPGSNKQTKAPDPVAKKTFTITNIQPDMKNGVVNITFSEKCGPDNLRKYLSLSPPLRLHWYESRASENTVSLKAKFKPGQNYTISIAETTECGGLKYAKTLNSFRMPDLERNVAFAESESVIERDGRQMVHAKVSNVDELVFRGLRIPPVLLPYILKSQEVDPGQKNNEGEGRGLRRAKKAKIAAGLNADAEHRLDVKGRDISAVKSELERKYAVIKKVAGESAELANFMGVLAEDSQLFFPGKELNQTQKFSMPLGFRSDKEKGAIELIQLKSGKIDQKAPSPMRLFRITDMGITYKIAEGSLLIWVTSLNTGKPLADVSLAVFTKDSGVVPLGKTDSNGILFINDLQEKKRFSFEGEGKVDQFRLSLKNISIIAAASPSDSSFVEMKRSGNLKPDWITQEPSIVEKTRTLKGHVFTERGIYRPGDMVFFKGTAREFKSGDILPPQGSSATFVIINSKDEEIYKKELALSEFGTAADSLDIKPFFPLGTYTINMSYPGGSVSSTFQIQEFRAPRHFVEVGFKRDTKKDAGLINLKKELDLLQCNISSVYYAGGPVKHGKLRWKIYLTGTDFKRKEYADYTFGSSASVAGEDSQNIIESGESILDEKGKLTVTVPLPKDVLSGLSGVEISATVVDFDGRSATETVVYQEEPEYILGISSHDSSVNAGNPQILKVVVLGKDNKRIDTGMLDVDVMAKDYTYVRKRNGDGDVYWENKVVYRKRLSTSLKIEQGTAVFDFDFLYGGEHILKFTYRPQSGKIYSSSTRYDVNGYYDGYERESRTRNFERLTVIAEKREYSPGDTMRVYFNTHKKLASMLMTVEREGIIQSRNIDMKPGLKYVDIPVDPSFIPNVYISLLGTTARGEFPLYKDRFDDEAPDFLFGVANVDIKKEVRELKVLINEDEQDLKAEPSSEVRLKLTTLDNAGKGAETEMAVCVVDESVLALTRFKTPTLDTLSKFTAPLSVFTGELRLDLLKQTPYGFIRNEPLTGGDGADSKDFATSKMRKDFRPVAYFNSAVKTDKNGKAEVTFTLPDSMTNYRVYAVACDKKDGFASVQRGLLAVRDFYLEPGTPRFFTKGDRFKFSVSAFNKTVQAGAVRFKLTGDEKIELALKENKYSLAAMDRALIPIQGEAKTAGLSTVAFSGEMNGKKDSVEIKIPVKSGHAAWNDIVFGTIKKQAHITYAYPEGTEKIKWNDLGPDEVKALLTFSGSPFLKISPGLKYLLKYPYGCVEQTSSGVIPLSALRGLVRDGLISDISVAEADKFLKPGIERLLSMQVSNGGFGYWPGDRYANLWGTVYATTALTYAKLAGLDVPPDSMKKALQYLIRAMGNEGKGDSSFKGYASYVLSLNKALDKGLFRDVYGDIKNMSREGALLTLMAAKLGDLADQKELMEHTKTVLGRKWEEKEPRSFYARFREPAVALLASSLILKDEGISGKLAKELLGGINKNGIWTSTSDTGWALVALGEYFKGKLFTGKPIKITVEQKGWPETSVTLDPKRPYHYSLDASSFLKRPEAEVSVDSDADVVFMLELTFPRTDYAASGRSKGFRINKTLQGPDGTGSIKVGDVVKVRLDIETEGDYDYIVLDDPLPAGLVAINTAIKTEERVGSRGKRGGDSDDEDNSDGYWDYWDPETESFKFVPNHFEMRDDRVLVFKNRAWRGQYQYTYYARAVCEGEFVMPSTKIQLMYEPDTASFTPVKKIVIGGR